MTYVLGCPFDNMFILKKPKWFYGIHVKCNSMQNRLKNILIFVYYKHNVIFINFYKPLKTHNLSCHFFFIINIIFPISYFFLFHFYYIHLFLLLTFVLDYMCITFLYIPSLFFNSSICPIKCTTHLKLFCTCISIGFLL